MFASKSKPLVGIDIGSSSVKLVELVMSSRKPRLAAWAIEPMPSGAISENTIANPTQVVETISKAITKSGSRAEDAAIAISSSHAITKVLSMPKDMKDYEIEEQVSVEALHFIPYPIEEVNLDFEVMGSSATSPDDENDVLLVACRKTIVDAYVEALEESGLTPKIVDIDTYALERVYRSADPFVASTEELTAIFDIGAITTHMTVVDGDRVLYTRHQSFGSKQLLQLVRKEYGVGAEEAEGLIVSAKPPADYYESVLLPFSKMVSQEISRALQFFYSSSMHSKVDNILLTGGCASLQGLNEEIENEIDFRTKVLDPFNTITLMGDRDTLERSSKLLTVATGLALRGST